MSACFDEGLALFAGLDVIPKREFLTDIIADRSGLLSGAHASVARCREHVGLPHGVSFDLDFHTIPFHGKDALVQKHDVSKRSRRRKGMLAFLAHDADSRVSRYADGSCRKRSETTRFSSSWPIGSDAPDRFPANSSVIRS